MHTSADVVVVGGGISGISLAARLAESRRVVVLEAEEHLGSHATGRPAALLVEAYGPPEIRTLTGLSRAFFEAPPAGFSEAPLSRRRGGLVYAGADALALLQQQFELAGRSASVSWLDAKAVLDRCPVLKPGVAAAGFLEPDALDLDANALLHGFARSARGAGALVHARSPVESIERRSDAWRIRAGGVEFACDVLVNAAGAWAERIAAMAGLAGCGLQPMRRTAASIPVPQDVEALLPTLPFAAPVDESFYFKPEARSIMVSLSDETPSEPCDAYADDYDVALALERFHAATTVPPVRPSATWAGLRTFAPDRRPVVGFDSEAPGFFWYAGQGGYGIQTSPALSILGAKLILSAPLEETEGGLAQALAPERLRGGRES